VQELGAEVLDMFPSALKGKDAKVQEYFIILRRPSS
jgi:hypothetical protein